MSPLFIVALFVSAASASIDQAPPSFPYQDGEAVYVDFQKATYHITYDFKAATVSVDSEIVFEMPKKGFPIFDLIPEPKNVKLDDRDAVAALASDPDKASKFRVLQTLIAPGSHRLTLSHVITENVAFRGNGVASAFWMSDLSDREYLEQYLPTNMEFDQYPMSMRVEVVNAAGMPHVLHANGVVTNSAENVFTVEFPAFYTTSSVFFHLSPKDAIASQSFTVKSVDGRDLPVEIYTNGNLSAYSNEVKRVIAELEKDYGAFPHAKVIVYGAGSGGMEYSGATMTSLSAVGHELFHSYNARAVMPAQGNAGWMDEAISSWRDGKYARHSSAGGTTMMAGHSVWTRMTDDDAYSKGADFLAWIAGRMESGGKNLKDFLRSYFHTNFYTTKTTQEFQAELEKFSGLDLSSDFAQYIYGKPATPSTGGDHPKGSVWGSSKLGASGRDRRESIAKPVVENPYHPRLTKEQLRSLL